MPPELKPFYCGFGEIKGSITLEPKPEPRKKIERVMFDAPATVVFWTDGTKTVVKCTECIGHNRAFCKYFRNPDGTCSELLVRKEWMRRGVEMAYIKKHWPRFSREIDQAIEEFEKDA